MFHSRSIGCSYGYVLNHFFFIGAVTMTAFFMLSGFVNEYSFGGKINCQKTTTLNFYVRRLISVLPGYYFTMVLYDLFVSDLSLGEILVLLPTEMMGLQSYYSSLFSVGHNGGTWFVSCILLCYALFPIITQYVEWIENKTKLLVILFLTLILFYLPLVTHEFSITTMYANPFTRFVEYSIGVLLASAYKGNQGWNGIVSKKQSIVILLLYILCVFGLVIYVVSNNLPMDYMLYSIIFLPVWILLIAFMTNIRIHNKGILKIIQFISEITYDMFLVQFFVWPVIAYIEKMFDINNFIRIVLSFGLCIGMSSIMHYLFEKPIQLKLRRWLVNDN